MHHVAAAVLLAVLAAGSVPARLEAAAVPAPAGLLGFSPRDRPARHADILRYAAALAAASPRVDLERHGATHEGRGLVHLIISDESNLSRLDAVRAAIGELADPRKPLSSARLQTLVADTPAVAWLGYSIHGDEFSGADAALLLAHHLATSEDEQVRAILRQLVVIIDPLQNPDGRDRILSMGAAFAGSVPNADPETLSHQCAWPWGRTNHYLFDLNRDWFSLVHPESRGRAEALLKWKPQLVVDAHEMGSESTYLFNPPRAPFNPNLPAATREWWAAFSRDQARAFDARGWGWFTREWNEEFFPGYGSSVQLYQGAVGILHEQAGTDGQSIRKLHGTLLTYDDAVSRQFASSLANLTTAAARRADLLLSYRAARSEAVERGRSGGIRAFYFAPVPDAARAERLDSALRLLGIEVERLSQPGRLASARTATEDGARAVELPAGTRRVRLDQPAGLLARAVLEAHSTMPDAFLAEEREHLEREKGTRVYDATAWSMLVASGLDAWWSERPDGLAWEREEGGAGGPAPARSAGGILAGPVGPGWAFDGTPDGSRFCRLRLVPARFALGAADEPARRDAGRESRSLALQRPDRPERLGWWRGALGRDAGGRPRGAPHLGRGGRDVDRPGLWSRDLHERGREAVVRPSSTGRARRSSLAVVRPHRSRRARAGADAGDWTACERSGRAGSRQRDGRRLAEGPGDSRCRLTCSRTRHVGPAGERRRCGAAPSART